MNNTVITGNSEDAEAITKVEERMTLKQETVTIPLLWQQTPLQTNK